MLPLIVIISFVLLSSNAQKYLSYISPTIQNEVAYQEESNSYCIDPIVTLDLFGLQTSNGTANGDNLSGLYYALEEVVITVKTSSPLETLSWHSVKGVSTDDLHTLLEAAVWRIFAGAPNPDPDPLSAKQSLVRDIFSSCPSPLFSISRSVCEMPFSAFGTACVSIATDKDVIVDLHVTKRFNRRLHTYLPIGILLVYFAGYLAKSKIFQYSSAVVISVLAGLILLGVYIVQKILLPLVIPKGNAGSVPVLLTVLSIVLFIFSFGATFLWYLKNTLRLNVLILENWEISFAYFAVAAIFGLFVTRSLRAKESSKHVLTLGVKWVLRVVGTGLVYNSFSSPLISLLATTLLALLYAFYAFNKFVLTRLLNRNKGDFKSKKKQ